MRCVCVFIPPTSTEHIQYLCKVLEMGSSTGDQSVVMSVLQLDVRNAGIGSACLEVIPTWKEGASAPSGGRVRRPCTWVPMMPLAKEGLARLNPQGCGMPMEDCDHGVISYTG